MSDLNRHQFPIDELVRIPPPKNPVVLKSGGPVMDLETVEGDKGLCSWTGEDGRIARAVFPLVTLYKCSLLVESPKDSQ